MWMCLFHWSGTDAQSRAISGQSYARSALTLRKRHAQKQIYLYKVRCVGFRYLPKWRYEHLAYFCQQLAILLDAGFALHAALNIVHQQTEHPWLRLALPEIVQAIESGCSLTMACQQYPMLFDTFFLALIHTGEQSGQLQACLTRLKDHYHRLSRTRKQATQAMFYPMLVTCFGLMLIAALTHWSLPQTEKLFSQANVPLPQLTQLLLQGYHSVQQMFFYILMTLGVSLGILSYLNRVYAFFQPMKERLYFLVPGIRFLRQSWQGIHFLDALSLCYASGIAIDKATDIAIHASHSPRLQQEREAILFALREGYPLTEILQPLNLFPNLIIELLRTGECSGSFEKMSLTCANWLEQQANERLARLLKILEPSLLIIFGCLLGILILALYLPLFQLAELMG